MGDIGVVPDRGALAGAAISAVFGVVWTQWGARGITGTPSWAVRVTGIALGLVIVLWSARLGWSAPSASSSALHAPSPRRSMFSTPSYLVVVAIQLVAFGGGSRLLTASGHSDYIIAWIAVVVGAHFLAFGRLFFVGFYCLGAAMIAAGLAGALVGLAGGGSGGIKATSGLTAAASLFAAGAWAVLRAQASTHVL